MIRHLRQFPIPVLLAAWFMLPRGIAQEPPGGGDRAITPAEIEIYRSARHIDDLSQEELVQAFPELSHIEFDLGQEQLAPLLVHVGERIRTMFHDLPNTASTEDVSQDYSGFGGREFRKTNRTFEYLFLTPGGRDSASWEEVRTDSKGRPVEYEQMRGTGFLTSGYAGLAFLFHPREQPGSTYRYLGRDSGKRNEYVVAFAQKPDGTGGVGSFSADGVRHSLLLQGLAWIDPQTNQIVRMRTELLAPRSDIGLYRQSTEIWFMEVRFKNLERSLWLPREVIVNVDYRNRNFRNRHHYSDYRLFTVESFEKRERPAGAASPEP